MNVTSRDAYDLLRNPRKLDATTPPWFGIRIRNDESEHAVDAYLETTRPELILNGNHKGKHEKSEASCSVDIDYWCFLLGIFPFPWTSEVTRCGHTSDGYEVSYRQKSGPYAIFEHSHWIRDGHGESDCVVRDTIHFDVFGEPLVNFVAGHILTKLLRERAAILNNEYGGRIVTVQ